MMGLQKQTIEIPLGKGIESKQTKQTMPVDALKRCHNGRWVESNRIEKRPPYVSIGRTLYSAADASAGTMTGATQLGECNGQVLAVNAETYDLRLCACVDAAAGTWRQSNRLPQGYCTRSPVYRATPVQPDSQSARAGGLIATVVSGIDNELRAIVHDESTGEVAVAEKTLTSFGGTYTVFRVVALGTWVVVIYLDPGNGEIWARCLNTADPSLGWSWPEVVTVAHFVSTTRTAIDLEAVVGSTTDVVFAYNESVAGLLVQKYRRDHAAATWSTLATSAAVGEVSEITTAVRQSGDGTHVLLAWISPAGTHRPQWLILNSDMTLDTAQADLNTDDRKESYNITACAQPATGKAWCIVYDNGPGSYPLAGASPVAAEITFVPIVAGVAGTPQRLFGYSLASYPVVGPTAWTTRFVAKSYDTDLVQCSYFLVRHLDVDWDGGGSWYLDCVSAPRQAGARYIDCATVLHAPTATTFHAALGVGLTEGATRENGLDRFTWTTGGMYSFVPVGDSTLVLGSQPMIYDGAHCTQNSFPMWPEMTPAVADTGGYLVDGTYYYRACLAYRHADGRVERSAPSKAISVIHPAGTLTNATTLSLIQRPLDRHWSTDIADIGTSDKSGQAYYEIYRTTLADSINFHLVGSTALISNDAYYTTFVDTLADASITTAPYIYTTEAAGEPVANTCPGSARFGCVHRGRVWLAGTEDPFVVWFSKYLRPGEGISFTDEFTIDMRDQGQPITGLASLEDKLVVFTESQTFVVYGDGPTDAGGDPGLDPPLRISGQIGCLDDRSIVQCPAGVFFLARGGIYQVDKGLSVTFAGSPARSTVAAFPTCLAAVHAEKEHQVRWLLRNATMSTILLCYDYLHGQWVTAAPVNGNSFEASCLHAASVGGACHLLTSGGNYGIGYENSAATSYLDTIVAPGGFYALTIETPDYHLGAIQGYQRVWRAVLMLENVASHDLFASVYYDYSATIGESKSWTAAQITALPAEQVQINPAKQTARAVRFAFYDGPSAVGSYKGFAAISIALEYGVANGLTRLPTAARR